MTTILVTGASRGIGLEFTRQYLAQGEKVIACVRASSAGLSNLGELSKLQNDFPTSLVIESLDVTKTAEVVRLKERLVGEPIDLLINNAGVLYDQGIYLGELDYEKWLTTFEVNTLGPIRIAEALLENVAASQRKLIVSLTSHMGSIGDNKSGGYYLYRSSKAALNAAMKSFSHDVSPQGVTVILLHPGWVHTDMGGTAAPLTPSESVRRMRSTLEKVRFSQSGMFLNLDGTGLPW